MTCVVGFQCPARSGGSDYAQDERQWRSPSRPKGLLSEVLARYQLQASHHAALSDNDEDDFSGSDYSDDEDSMSGRMSDSPSSSVTSSPCSQPIPIPEPRSLPYSLAWQRARARAQQVQQQAYAADFTTKHMLDNNHVNHQDGRAVGVRK